MRTKLRDKRLYWRGDVIWCRIVGASGRIERQTTKCRDEAAAVARANEYERIATDPSYAAASATTLSGGITALLKDKQRRGNSATTLKIAAEKTGHFVRMWGADLPMIRISAPLVLEYVDKRKAEGAKDYTIKKEVNHLRQLLKICRHIGTFHVDVERVLPPYLAGSYKPKKRAPMPAEIEALGRHLSPRRFALVLYVLATGARKAEAFRALRSDARWTERLVTMHGTKTEGASDDVPITRVNERILAEALRLAPGSHRLFDPWGNMYRDLEAACVRAGIPNVTSNDLRRAFGTWHRLAGVDVTNVSKLLRHTTDKLAQTTYADVRGKDVGMLVEHQIKTVPILYAATAETASDGGESPSKGPENAGELQYARPDSNGRHSASKAEYVDPRSQGNKRAWARRHAASVSVLYAEVRAIPSGNPSDRAFRATSWRALGGGQ